VANFVENISIAAAVAILDLPYPAGTTHICVKLVVYKAPNAYYAIAFCLLLGAFLAYTKVASRIFKSTKMSLLNYVASFPCFLCKKSR